MIHIAIVEDSNFDRRQIAQFVKRYGDESGKGFKITEFGNAIVFLENYKPVYDAVFLDVQMPHMDGMQAAEKLRESDSTVPIVFITNMSNFAVKGYSVSAVDFVVKPVSYYNFSAMMSKVVRICESRSGEIMLKTVTGGRRLSVNEIIYVEVIGHKVIYHTEKEDVEIWDTLKTQEDMLAPYGFARCNNYCLVNLKYVDNISGTTLSVKDVELSVTRTKKKEFMQKLVEYYGKNL